MLGIGCFALPVAIIGRGFYEEIRRRDFIVTFAMVAQVPLFAALGCTLDSRARGNTAAPARSPAGDDDRPQRDRGDAMYLIASGAVDVDAPSGKVRLEEGDFFGEMALLSREPRSATVTAVRATDLLVLDVDDFLDLLDRLPDIGAKVQDVSRTAHGNARAVTYR